MGMQIKIVVVVVVFLRSKGSHTSEERKLGREPPTPPPHSLDFSCSRPNFRFSLVRERLLRRQTTSRTV